LVMWSIALRLLRVFILDFADRDVYLFGDVEHCSSFTARVHGTHAYINLPRGVGIERPMAGYFLRYLKKNILYSYLSASTGSSLEALLAG